jgi:hypothetical protein
VEVQRALGCLRCDVEPLIGEHGRQSHGLPPSLIGIHVHLASSRLEDHEPDQPRPDDEPDDEQPPVEFGIHRREV